MKQVMLTQNYYGGFAATPGLVSGALAATVVADGITKSSSNVIVTERTPGFYFVSFYPTETGSYLIYVAGNVLEFEVVMRDFATVLASIEDEALGTWSLDKLTGVLTLYKQSGSVLQTYQTSDTSTTTSKLVA